MRFLKMAAYQMVSIFILSSAWDKTGFVAGALWVIGLLAALNASLYFWEWTEPEDFKLYTSENKNWRNVTIPVFWCAVFALAFSVSTGWVS
jgi:hypothetical protein|tara:strand:- start:503 stop:775 length:273 start_codon:yes stop_codon:yes gene_type:complete